MLWVLVDVWDFYIPFQLVSILWVPLGRQGWRRELNISFHSLSMLWVPVGCQGWTGER